MCFQPEHLTGRGFETRVNEGEGQLRFRQIKTEVGSTVRMLFPLMVPLFAGGSFETRAFAQIAPPRLPAEQDETCEQAKPEPPGRAKAAVAAQVPDFVAGDGPDHGGGAAGG